MIILDESEKRMVLRFSTRRVGKHRKPVEVIHFYNSTGGKIFHARCERGVVSSFLERINGAVRRSRTGKTIYLDGARAEEFLRKLIILAGCRQCLRVASKVLEIKEVLASLGEFETIFWYSKMIEGYEKKGFLGVCIVARAFRVLYRIY